MKTAVSLLDKNAYIPMGHYESHTEEPMSSVHQAAQYERPIDYRNHHTLTKFKVSLYTAIGFALWMIVVIPIEVLLKWKTTRDKELLEQAKNKSTN